MLYEFFTHYPIIAVIFIVMIAVAVVYLFVKWMQNLGLEKIRKIVYDGFVTAEHNFQHSESQQKFEYVVQLARSHLPSPFDMFITEKLLRQVIQLWFDLCKDLLDDGKINNK